MKELIMRTDGRQTDDETKILRTFNSLDKSEVLRITSNPRETLSRGYTVFLTCAVSWFSVGNTTTVYRGSGKIQTARTINPLDR